MRDIPVDARFRPLVADQAASSLAVVRLFTTPVEPFVRGVPQERALELVRAAG
jgi:hypothetical protein